MVGPPMGSSPLARGLPENISAPAPGMRIIPARAGFTYLYVIEIQNIKDHPRSRGVYCGRRRPTIGRQGSSPLARGLRGVEVDHNCGSRIIPARAGFTTRSRRRSPGDADHPRSRGVYPEFVANIDVEAGSSPLARGLQITPGPIGPGVRIIPARAGFTERPLPYGVPVRDHPRSRGVYGADACGACVDCGSSPLARGLLILSLSPVDTERIIPARAGFTRRQ